MVAFSICHKTIMRTLMIHISKKKIQQKVKTVPVQFYFSSSLEFAMLITAVSTNAVIGVTNQSESGMNSACGKSERRRGHFKTVLGRFAVLTHRSILIIECVDTKSHLKTVLKCP